MNKKQIIAGMLAGGLLLTATSASAETAGNSKTTSEAKTSIEWKSLKINSKELSLSDKELNKLLQKFNINKELIVGNLVNIKTETPKKNGEAQQVQKETKEVTKKNNEIKEIFPAPVEKSDLINAFALLKKINDVLPWNQGKFGYLIKNGFT
ncbi:MAG: hypothetical protein ABS934_11925, partial [Psychrobacillus sp.]